MSQPRQLHPDASGVIHPDRESAMAATVALGEKQKADEKSLRKRIRMARKPLSKGNRKTTKKPRKKKA